MFYIRVSCPTSIQCSHLYIYCRIKYREQLQDQKREEQRQADEKQLEIERMKERNLEKLREQVTFLHIQ